MNSCGGNDMVLVHPPHLPVYAGTSVCGTPSEDRRLFFFFSPKQLFSKLPMILEVHILVSTQLCFHSIRITVGCAGICAGSCMASGSRCALGPYSTLDPIDLVP